MINPPPIKLPPIREIKVIKAINFLEYSYKLIFDKQEFILDGKLRENLESEYGLIRQIDDILDGDTGITYSFDKKVELIRWYESQGGIKETVNH